MGAWGMGSLENDSSLDWLADFEDLGPEAAVEILDATDHSLSEGYIDVDVGGGVIVLAEILAASRGKPNPALQEQLSGPLGQHRSALLAVDDLRPRTLKALDAVLSGAESSELYDLWEEAGAVDAWAEQVREVKSRLAAA
ncbi:DUF4259 domain-containing protein [Yoonia sp. 2307UL14-13]|uniref:DUF4259 domain-containing protein n=1 Tax=Yoonia sp. 2307UL14-13 TaxID=3126506 RepID=UPI0030AF9B8C